MRSLVMKRAGVRAFSSPARLKTQLSSAVGAKLVPFTLSIVGFARSAYAGTTEESSAGALAR